ncbi:MAG TPA: DHA2 family efflux MFS transporter permease subunit [Candidatus Sulfotelmatobacter sp.]|jgi:EmrB/QacA subfamily drug resistance transporter|nr:DHA2 family efflux MFS transporter permease subunit [Candidatus Sulfotelmatobacter sp.]
MVKQKEKINVTPQKKGFTGAQWAILGTLMISSFLGRLDGTIVSLATPKIITDFGISVTEASYITTAYVLGNAVFVPVFGKLGDLIGRKPLYLFGIIGFVISSMLAGLSWDLSSMIFFRVLQAVTVSIDYPIALAIIAFEFVDKRQRLQAQAIWSSIFAASIVFGPLLGGPLTDTFGWRSVFYVNIPLGAIGAFMAMRYIREPVEKIKGIKHFDWFGSILLGISLAAMVLVLDRGQNWGWTSTASIISYIVSTVTLILFIFVEQREKEPVVDLDFFKIPAFTIANLASFISMMGLFGGIFLIPIFAQNILGYSVTKSGYLFIPMAVGIMSGAQIGVRLAQKIPPRYFVSLGMFWGAFMLYLFSGIDVKWEFWDIGIRLGLFAFGIGLGFGPLTQAAVSTVPIQEVGVASSVLALSRNLAGAFGTAIFATILSNSTTASLINIQNNTIIHTTDPQLLKIIPGLMEIKASILAYGSVFKWAAVFVIAGGIATLFLKEVKSSDVTHQTAIEA